VARIRRPMQVSFAPAVPVDKPLVVGTKPSTKPLYALLLVCVVLEVALAAAVLGVALWREMPLLLAALPFLALQVWMMARIISEYQGLLGPQLAADHTGIWVRTGLGSRPETVYLPWPAVDGIDAMPKGPVLRIMSRAGDALFHLQAVRR
jgi:hypothetical protein